VIDRTVSVLGEHEARAGDAARLRGELRDHVEELRVLRGVVFRERFNFGTQTDNERPMYDVIDDLVAELCAEVAEEPHEDDRGGSTGLPPLIRDLLSPKFRDATRGESLPNLRMLLRDINRVYLEKLKADAADDRDGSERQPMPEFLYDHFTNRYGLRPVAEQHLVNFVFALNKHEAEDTTVETFNRFLDRHPTTLCDMFLAGLRLARESKHGAMVADTDGHGTLLTSQRAVAVARVLFDGYARDQLRTVEAAVAARCRVSGPELLKKHAGLRKQDMVPTLTFLEIVVDEFYAEHRRARERLARFFDDADRDGNGALEFDEFRELVERVNAAVPARRAARLFRERCAKTGSQGLSRRQFITFGPAIGLGVAWKTAQWK
jgi:hypothetical protein